MIGNKKWEFGRNTVPASGKFLALIVSILASGHALAQDYPNKPIRITVNVAPGGVDTYLRVLTPTMSRISWGNRW